MERNRFVGAAGLMLLALTACQGPERAEPAAATERVQPASRSPSSLSAIMQGLAAEMDRVSAGLWAEEYDTIAAAARSIAEHPKIGPRDRAAIAGALGDDFPSFAAKDAEAHDAAVALGEAARNRDAEQILASLARVQQSCVACHSGFRDRVRAALSGTR